MLNSWGICLITQKLKELFFQKMFSSNFRYYFKVQAKNPHGYGPISPSVSFVTESGISNFIFSCFSFSQRQIVWNHDYKRIKTEVQSLLSYLMSSYWISLHKINIVFFLPCENLDNKIKSNLHWELPGKWKGHIPMKGKTIVFNHVGKISLNLSVEDLVAELIFFYYKQLKSINVMWPESQLLLSISQVFSVLLLPGDKDVFTSYREFNWNTSQSYKQYHSEDVPALGNAGVQNTPALR